MICRRHQEPGRVSEAVFSDCGAYRYSLTRRWSAGALVNFVMLNPSQADERRNDPTVERCERRARAMGFGAMSVTNLFALRETDPMALRRAAAPEGPGNDAVLLGVARDADRVIAAWGLHGAHRGREAAVLRLLRGEGVVLWHFGLTRDGHPRHPLYLAYDRQPEPWPDGPQLTGR